MAEIFDGLDTARLRNKDWPWWYAEIAHRLRPEGRDLFEKCGVPAPEIEDHIRKIRDEAWDIFPFPCVGQFWFVEFDLSRHPRYHEVVSLLKQSSHQVSTSTDVMHSNGEYVPIVGEIISRPGRRRLLDIGTCVGQDLRMLRHHAVPSENLYGTDILPGFERVGHDLFLDAESFQNHFIQADIFDESPASSLHKTTGLWDVITANMFIHQFDLDHQQILARQMVRLLRKTAGSIILGSSTGQLDAGSEPMKPPFTDKDLTKIIYRNNKESMHKLWESAVAECGGGSEDWDIDCTYDEKGLAIRESERKAQGEVHFFVGDRQRRIYYYVRRR